ncbi:hypothetical protein HY095_02465 [Candidatus Micrarchaeota archaeon]|nr:hypothetical protein [Candidatus Micrarchaeota archaeon]
MYVTIPVKRGTKLLIDERKEEFGLQTYDETLRVLARKDIRGLLKFEGVLKDAPPFVRDKLERRFD